MKSLLRSIGVAALCALSASAVHADEFPTKNVVMVIPFSAGGPTDVVGRIIAQSMTNVLKKQVIVENTPGAGGTVAAARVARAAPDGYTILLHHIGQSTAPTLYRKLPYNPIESFEPIGLVTDVPMTLIAKKDFPAKDLKELISYVKANKDKVSMANAGLGSASQLCGMLFMSAIDTELTTVPYKGTGPAMNDLMGGQVDFMCDQTTNTTGQIEAKKVKAFAVTTPKRLSTPALKNLPTLQELGLANFQVTIWHGLYAPKGTPEAVVKTLNDALKVALKDPDFIKREEALGAVIASDKRVEPAEHKKFVQAEIAKWGAVIKAAGTYAD